MPVRGDDDHIMFINDEGKLDGAEYNANATILADLPTVAERKAHIAALRAQGIMVIDATDDEEDYIAGTTLYCLDSEVR